MPQCRRPLATHQLHHRFRVPAAAAHRRQAPAGAAGRCYLPQAHPPPPHPPHQPRFAQQACGRHAMFYLAAAVSDFYVPWCASTYSLVLYLLPEAHPAYTCTAGASFLSTRFSRTRVRAAKTRRAAGCRCTSPRFPSFWVRAAHASPLGATRAALSRPRRCAASRMGAERVHSLL